MFPVTSVFSWQNSVSLGPASFCTPKPNLPVTPGGSEVKGSAWHAGDPGSIPGLGRHPAEGSHLELQASLTLEYKMKQGKG